MYTFMKSRLLILALAIFTLSSFRANAQVDVTVNPIGLLFGGINVGADFVLADEFSIEANVGYNSRTDDVTFNTSTNEFKYTGIPIQAVGKYYFSPDDGADRFYAAAFLRYVNRTYNEKDVDNGVNDFSQSRFGAGVGFGTKSVSRSGIVFDFGVNVGRAIADSTKFETENGQEEVDLPGFIFTLKLGIGYRFGG